MNILIPMAGAGKRFADAGYIFPKPLIEIDNKKFFYPHFLIDSSFNYGNRDLYKGLVLNKFVLKKFVFEPNKIRFPEVRERIEKKANETK